jgi:hypothetical protein
VLPIQLEVTDDDEARIAQTDGVVPVTGQEPGSGSLGRPRDRDRSFRRPMQVVKPQALMVDAPFQ